MPTDPTGFRGQRVLIIGKGNSAFETAANLIATARRIHLVSPSPVRMACRTHYVGDVRAVNSSFLDTHHLKGENAILDARVLRIASGADRERSVTVAHGDRPGQEEDLVYDRVLVCTGFRFDSSIFDESCTPELTIEGLPAMTSAWEATNVPGLYFAGTLMRSRHSRIASSGFIHGFRHNVAALHRILETRYQRRGWPYFELPREADDLARAVLTRANLASSLWNQPGVMADVIVLDRQCARYYRDLPADHVQECDIVESRPYFVITIEHAADLDGELQPVIRRCMEGRCLSAHRVREDFMTRWVSKRLHQTPLAAFFAAQLTST